MHIEAWSGLWFAWTLPAILLLYLLKRKYIDTEVSSRLLWQQVLREMEANRPWQRLRRNSLLLLQLLIAALLVLALLRPFVWSDHKGPAHLVLVLDRSASMLAYADGNGPAAAAETRFDQAKRMLVNAVKEAAAGSKFTVIATGREPDVLLAGGTSVSDVEAALRDIRPFPGKTAYKESMSLAASLVRNDPQAELRFFTDGQWADDTGGLRVDAPFHLNNINAQESDNVSIVQFGVRVALEQDAAQSGTGFAAGGIASDGTSPLTGTASGGTSAAAQGGRVDGVATVKNWGAREKAFDASLYVQGRLDSVQQVRLSPGEQKSIYFSGLPSGDFYRLSLDVDDRLGTDNQAYAFAGNNRTRTALLLGAGNLFLEKALKLAHIDVVKAQKNDSGLYVLPASRIDFVVLDGVQKQEIASPEWEALLAAKPVWTIGAAGGGDKTALTAQDFTIRDHPVTRYVQFLDVHIAEAFRAPKVSWGEPVVSAGPVPLVYAGTEQGQPRLLFAFDLHASDLPLRSEFPIVVQNAADWLGASAGSSLGRAVAGDTIDIPLSPKTAEASWVVLEGESPGSEAEIPKEALAGGARMVPDRTGLYRLVEKDGEGNPVQTRYLEVYMDPREANLSYRPELNFQAGPPSDGDAPAAGADGRAPYPLANWIASLVLLLLLAEWGVYRRGNTV